MTLSSSFKCFVALVIISLVAIANSKPTQKHKIVLIGDELSMGGSVPFTTSSFALPAAPKEFDDDYYYYSAEKVPQRKSRRPPPPKKKNKSRKPPAASASLTQVSQAPLLDSPSPFPSTLRIPLQVAKDVNAMVRVGYWSTRAAFVNYLSKINNLVGTNTVVDKFDTNQQPTTLIETLYTLVN